MNKPRLIFVPQLPTKMRYTEWWVSEFYNNLNSYFSEIVILGETYLRNIFVEPDDNESFSNIKESIIFENTQMVEYINLELKEDDILFGILDNI